MRIESKYHLDAHGAHLLREELLAMGFALDRHCAGGRAYTVRSIYLDSPSFDAYHDKEEGISRRAKYRLRCYVGDDAPSGAMNLEVKEKDASLSWKAVRPVGPPEVERFVAGGAGPLADRIDPAAGYLEPMIGGEYERLALVHPVHEARITLDFCLRWRAVDRTREGFLAEASFEPLASDEVILEVKVPREHSREITRLVRRWDLHWVATSKYAICIEHMEQCWLR